MQYFDIIIIGGGPVGLATAIGLAQQNFSVALIEHKEHQSLDTRWFAIGYDMIQWLLSLGVDIEYGWIDRIHLSTDQEKTPIFFDLSHSGHRHLAGMVASSLLREKLNHLSSCVRVFRPDSAVHWQDKGWGWCLSLASGHSIRAPLVIGADGRSSSVRKLFSPSTYQWSFPQKAVVFTFAPCAPLIAYEHFFRGGSLALLPLLEDKGAGIWIGQKSQMHDLDLKKDIQSLLGYSTRWLSELSYFDVQVMHVGHTLFHRCALLGDAAHTMHPIAGQGLNVGLRNAQILVHHLIARKRLGLDLGLGLEGVQRQWKLTALSMQAFTTGIVLGLSLCPIPGLWKMGSFALRRWPRLGRWMIKNATGSHGARG